MSLTVKLRKLQIDQRRIDRAIRRSEERALIRLTALTRTTASRSIRSGGKKDVVSNPGEPPRHHIGSNKLFKRSIQNAFDRARRVGIAGPIAKGKNVGRVLEHGGFAIVKAMRRGKVVLTRVFVKPRPFMRPALRKVIGTPAWKNIIKDFIRG